MDLNEIAENLIRGQTFQVEELVRKAIDEGEDTAKILKEGLLAGMGVVGERFKRNEIYVPEVLIAAQAMKTGTEVLKPLLVREKVGSAGMVVLGTVTGDIHDIGKNLVGMMLRGAGFEVEDLGINVPPERLIHAAKEKNAQVIGLSALLSTTMPAMKDVIEAADSSGLKENVKILVGGAPVTQDYADEIGADGYAPDAASAVDKVRELLAV